MCFSSCAHSFGFCATLFFSYIERNTSVSMQNLKELNGSFFPHKKASVYRKEVILWDQTKAGSGSVCTSQHTKPCKFLSRQSPDPWMWACLYTETFTSRTCTPAISSLKKDSEPGVDAGWGSGQRGHMAHTLSWPQCFGPEGHRDLVWKGYTGRLFPTSCVCSL